MTRLALLVALLGSTAAAQPADTLRARFQAFDAGGEALGLDAMLDEAVTADVVFVGEIHDDPTGHAVELAIVQGLHARADGRPVVLALEMFEADVQTVLDEYLAGLVSERDFREAARPWQNYADYRPLVEFAKANDVRVVAANAPVRYVRAVGRGADLAGLSPQALATLPPLPVAPASARMSAAFAEAMGDAAGHGGPSLAGMLAAQNLRDASMAFRTAEALRTPGRALVIHVNGGFHTSGGRGIPEHLARFAPDARTFLVQIEPVADVDARPAVEVGTDGLVQTPARLVPSRQP